MLLSRLRRIGQAAFLVICLLLLALPALWMVVGPPRALSEREGRSLATWPALPGDLTALRAWPSAAAAWLQDHLGGRDRLLSAAATLRQQLREPGGTAIVFGQDDWLFYAVSARMRLAAGETWLDAAHRDRVRQLFAFWDDAARAAGMAMVILLAPDKESIEETHLPWWALRFDSAPAIDRLLAESRAEGRFTIVDMRPVLAADASGRPRYWPFDTHWTIWSSYLAYRVLLDDLQQRWPGTRPLEGDDLAWISMPYGQDLWRILGQEPDPERQVHDQPWPRDFQKTNTTLPDGIEISERPDLAGPRVVLAGDSFRNALHPWLSQSLPLLINLPADAMSRLPAILQEHPGDLLVIVLVERDLHESLIRRLLGQ